MDAKKDGTKIFDIGEEKYKVGKKNPLLTLHFSALGVSHRMLYVVAATLTEK